jgi:hypothetical protein
MKNIPRFFFSPIFLTIILAAVLHSSIFLAATPCDPVVARMVFVQGDIEFLRAGQTQSQTGRLADGHCGWKQKNFL